MGSSRSRRSWRLSSTAASEARAAWPPERAVASTVEPVVGEPEIVADLGGPRVEVGAAEREVPLQGHVVVLGRVHRHGGVGRRERAGRPVELTHGRGHARAPCEVVAQRLARSEVGLLGEEADGGRGRGQPDRAPLRGEVAGEGAQQGALADAVRSDEADAVPGRDRERHRVEDGGGATRDGDVGGVEHRAGQRGSA